MTLIEFFAKLSLVCFIFFLPIESRWIFDQGFLSGKEWEYGTGSLYGTDALLFLSFIATLLWIWWKPQTGHASFLFPFFMIVGFGLMAVGSLGEADDREIGLWALARLWEGIVLWWVIQHSPLRPIILVLAFVGSATLEAAWGIEQFLFQIVPANHWLGEAFHSALQLGDSVIQTADGRFLRAYGTLPHPNILGGMLAVAAVFVFGLLIQKGYRVWGLGFRIILWSSFVFLLFGLFFTFSRSAWIGTTLVVVIISIWSWMKHMDLRRRIFATFIVFVVCGGALWAVFPESVSRFSTQETLESLSVSERAKEYNVARVIIRQNPLIGSGIGQYAKELQTIYPSHAASQIQPAHNIYLLVLSELGLIGLLVFLFIIAWHFSSVRSIAPPLIIAAAGGIIVLLTVGLFDHYLWSLHFGVLLFWFVLAIFFRLSNDSTNY